MQLMMSTLSTVSKSFRSQWLCSLARFRASHIVTVSEYSRRDVVRQYQLPAERISVTYEAADARFHQQIPEHDVARVNSKYGLPADYLFYVGSLERRKNLPFLLRALAAAKLEDLHLVVGGGNSQETVFLLAEAESLGLAPRVKMLGRVDDADLPALYRNARAFVYPSEYEGFGLQLCEAMAVGCPVLASDASYLPEILGEGGAIFPLASGEALTDLIRRIHLDGNYWDELHRKALTRSRRFSWKQTALETLEVYRSLHSAPETSLSKSFGFLSQLARTAQVES